MGKEAQTVLFTRCTARNILYSLRKMIRETFCALGSQDAQHCQDKPNISLVPYDLINVPVFCGHVPFFCIIIYKLLLYSKFVHFLLYFKVSNLLHKYKTNNKDNIM